MSLRFALHEHWPEYLIEGWALGCFMISVGVFATLLGSPLSPMCSLVPSAIMRTVLLGLAMGITAVVLIQSPWGKRSGAHMNPAVTLAFLRLGKMHPWDALFFIIAQAAGGTLGIVIVATMIGSSFTHPPVSYAVTVPGPKGTAVAFVAEVLISFGLMSTVLALSSSPRLARFTGVAVGCLLALYISVELPLSGTSMNPARTLASAAPGMIWQQFWVYVLAPPLGMLVSAQLHLWVRGSNSAGCAKLIHPSSVRCIHCGQDPSQNPGAPPRSADARSSFDGLPSIRRTSLNQRHITRRYLHCPGTARR
jgi:aquaporin Z